MEKRNSIDILNFIKQFSRYGKDVVDMFMSHSYWFAIILKEKFGGSIYYSKEDNLYACLVDDIFLYDINGFIFDATKYEPYE